jgi:hypothetical protein
MFRKLLPWMMAALMVVLVITGCSKKPAGPEDDSAINYAPASIVAYPDTVNVTVKWARNSEAEAQSGFGGYYVYCTSRSMTYAGGTTDSVVGLAQLPPESLQYFQVPGCPFVGIDSVVVTQDPLFMTALKRGTKYYFYVRTMVDGELSWASNCSWSSPLAQGDAKIFAFVPFDTLAGDSGLYAGLELKKSTAGTGAIIPTLTPRIPVTVWRDTLIDSTAVPPTMIVTPATHDSVICGYLLIDKKYRGASGDTLAKKTVVIIQSGKAVHKIRNYALVTMSTRVAAIDLVAKKLSATQVVLQSPMVNDAIPTSNSWGADGKDVLIQYLPGGWNISIPQAFLPTSQSIVLNVGESGNAYQLYISGCYVKIRVDEVLAVGNSIKVTFHYSYQMVAGIKSF